MSSSKNSQKGISFSSVETQRELRIEKLNKLKERGVNPFPPDSKRDFTLGFISFWFNFVHKFDFSGPEFLDNDLYTLDYFLQQVLFPRTLLEKMQDKLQLRHTVRQMGLDPDNEVPNFEEEFEPQLLDQARSLFPNILEEKEDNKLKYLREYIIIDEEADDDSDIKDPKLTLQKNQKTQLAGRIKSKRVSGKIAFATVEDESCPEGFQFIFKKDLLDEVYQSEKLDEKTHLTFEDFKDLIDEGDYIEAFGKLDYSQRGEPSLFVEKFRILTKAIRPLPEKLEDVEQKYRQRYLDMRLHPEVRDLFVMKSKFWSATKEFMDNNGFTQVFMPIMQETTGGAEANPFVTHHDALDEDFYLGISPELHLKRMIVGGFEKVYDLGKNFRNEGIDDEHLQEFLRVEFYWAYASHDDLMDFTENMMKFAIEKAFGTLQLKYLPKDETGDFTGEEVFVDWSQNWPRIPYYEFIKLYGGVDLEKYKTVEELRSVAKDLSIKFDDTDTFARLTDLIYKKTARPKCIQPTWVIDVPTRLSPLAKRDPKNPDISLRSHLLAYGSELTNGFSELNDPIDQLERFKEQQSARDGGDEEAMMLDMDFVQALEIAMPPTVGFAYSERLFDLLANKTMREATVFPLMRRQENTNGKAKRTMVAHAVILDTPEIPSWSKYNAVAHLSASFASREGKKLLHMENSDSKDGEVIPMNIQHAIMMKTADSSQKLLELKRQAEKLGLSVSVFTKEMRDNSDDEKVSLAHSQKTADQITYLGVLIFGKKGEVESLTDDFKLMD